MLKFSTYLGQKMEIVELKRHSKAVQYHGKHTYEMINQKIQEKTRSSRSRTKLTRNKSTLRNY